MYGEERIEEMIDWRRNLYAVWTAQFIALVGFSFVMPFMPFYVEELGVEEIGKIALWTGLLNTGPAAMMTIFAPIWGALADRRGRKVMVERATFGGAIIIASMGFATNVPQLMILRTIQGAITGTVPACTALVATSTPRERIGFALGMMQMAVFTGSSVGPLIGGIVADLIGYRSSFWVTGAMLFVAGLIVLFGVREDFQRPSPSEGKVKVGLWRNLRGMGVFQQLMAMAFIFFLVNFAGRVVSPVLPLMVKALVPGQQVASITGLMLAITGVVSALAAMMVGRVSDRMGYKRVLILMLLGAGIIYLPQAFVHSSMQLLMLRAVLGLFVGGVLPTANAIVGIITPDRSRGTAYGLASSASSLGNAVGPIAGGAFASLLGIRSVFAFTAAIFLIVGGWVMYTVREPKMEH